MSSLTPFPFPNHAHLEKKEFASNKVTVKERTRAQRENRDVYRERELLHHEDMK